MTWTTRRLETGNLGLSLAETGPPGARAVVLLHGFPETGLGLRGVGERLAAAGLRAIVPDLRGYGASDAPEGIDAYRLDALVGDALAILAEAGPQATLAGHDWGGVIAFAAAARAPERVDRLVAMNAPHLDAMGEVVRRRPSQALRSLYVGAFQAPFLPEAVLSAGRFALLSRAMTGSARPGAVPAELLAAYVEGWSRPGRLSAMLNYYRALLRRPRAPLGRIRPPTLIVWGRRDVALDVALARASLARCDDGRLLLLDRATHWVHLEEPDVVAREIAAFASA